MFVVYTRHDIDYEGSWVEDFHVFPTIEKAKEYVDNLLKDATYVIDDEYDIYDDDDIQLSYDIDSGYPRKADSVSIIISEGEYHE